MRAGLLSHPEVIDLINNKFISTWIIVDDAQRLAKEGNALAKTLIGNWQYPLDLMFLTENGVMISKLNSVQHLQHDVHKDVSHPAAKPGPAHKDVFVQHVVRLFGAE